MPDRFHRLMARTLLCVSLLLVASGLILDPFDPGTSLLFALTSPPFAIVGVLVASRRPDNPVGWLFLVFSVVAAFAAGADRYARYALLERPGSLPGGEWVAWISSGIWHPAFGFFVFAFLLFPEGRLPSARWRPVALIAALNYLMGGVLGLLWGPLFGEFFPYAEPPFRLQSYAVADVAFGVFIFVNFGLLVLSALSLVLRLRRATGVERQQIKWFVYAVALFAVSFPPSVLVFGDGRLIVLLLPLVPVSAGIAIFRYRLYDIDLIINRTLVYATLTAVLVTAYFGGVVTTQTAFRLLTGQEQQPQLAVVVSTLVIAALFNPLRHRVQSFIDRRFYRKKYDAARALRALSAKLRDQTNLEDLTGDLLLVVRDTVRPERTSLWLRRPEDGR